MSMRRVRYGALNCTVVEADSEQRPDRLAVLCHGFGAPGDDLVPLADELLAHFPWKHRVRFVFPAAPLSLDEWGMPGARAWWPISIQSLLSAFERGETDVLKDFSPQELPAVRDALDLCCSAALEDAGLGRDRLVLGGFSQGAMISTELALHRAERLAGLILWSGTLIRRPYWTQQAELTPPLRVVQSHGRQDTVLPFVTGEWLRDLLVAGGHDVNFLPFNGPHTIPMPAFEAAAHLLDAD
ncbi:MAG: hypothetical protein KDA83_01560 [Planctomycetales bacterium]|nr:hypothetical protein [Planctomycetales bacterium]